MKLTTIILNLLFLFTSTLVHAQGGSMGGNGGDAVVCNNIKPRMLDYVEAEFYGKKVDLAGKNFEEKALNTIKLLSSSSKKLSQVFTQNALELISDLKIYYSMRGQSLEEINSKTKNTIFTLNNLVDIPDSNHASVPVDCEVKQVVIHQEPQNQLQKQYLVDVKIISQFDEVNVAGLVLHESIYKFAKTIPHHSDSVQTRSLNIFLSSGKDLTNEQIVAGLIDFKFNSSELCLIDYFVQGFYVSSSNIDKNSDDSISTYLCEASEQKIGEFRFKFIPANIHIKNSRIIDGAISKVDMSYKMGTIIIEKGARIAITPNDKFIINNATFSSKMYTGKKVKNLHFENGTIVSFDHFYYSETVSARGYTSTSEDYFPKVVLNTSPFGSLILKVASNEILINEDLSFKSIENIDSYFNHINFELLGADLKLISVKITEEHNTSFILHTFKSIKLTLFDGTLLRFKRNGSQGFLISLVFNDRNQLISAVKL